MMMMIADSTTSDVIDVVVIVVNVNSMIYIYRCSFLLYNLFLCLFLCLFFLLIFLTTTTTTISSCPAQ